MSRIYHVFDGDGWYKFATIEFAKAAAEECIEIIRDNCDPEWPDCVEQVSVYLADEDCEEPDEDGELVLISTEIPVDHDQDSADFGIYTWVDYAMRPPKVTKQ